MNTEKFTSRAITSLALANQEAQRFNHEYIGSEHLLLGLIKEGSGIAQAVLKHFNFDLTKARLSIEKLVKSGPEMVTMGKLPYTPRAKKALEVAAEIAVKSGHNFIGTEHLLLGLLSDPDSLAVKAIQADGIKVTDIIDSIKNLTQIDFCCSKSNCKCRKIELPLLDAQKMVDLLNSAFENDPAVMSTLMNIRRICNKQLADHPDVIVHYNKDNNCFVGFMGILNGMLNSINSDKLIASRYDEKNNDIIGFCLVDKKEVFND
jgi:ATP-dependent Clp protease ATP-binding subunit ClpA